MFCFSIFVCNQKVVVFKTDFFASAGEYESNLFIFKIPGTHHLLSPMHCDYFNNFYLGGFCFVTLRKTRLSRVPYALRATYIPSLRFGTGFASPSNPCRRKSLTQKSNIQINFHHDMLLAQVVCRKNHCKCSCGIFPQILECNQQD